MAEFYFVLLLSYLFLLLLYLLFCYDYGDNKSQANTIKQSFISLRLPFSFVKVRYADYLKIRKAYNCFNIYKQAFGIIYRESINIYVNSISMRKVVKVKTNTIRLAWVTSWEKRVNLTSFIPNYSKSTLICPICIRLTVIHHIGLTITNDQSSLQCSLPSKRWRAAENISVKKRVIQITCKPFKIKLKFEYHSHLSDNIDGHLQNCGSSLTKHWTAIR